MSKRGLFAVCLVVGAAGAARAQDDTALRARLEARIARAPATAVGLYYRSLGRADSMLIGANLRLHAASTMKIPVMIQLFRDADAGLVRLDDSLRVHATFPSLADGSPFTTRKEDDSDSTLYVRIETQASLRELLDLMITRSSNLATNILIERVGAERAQRTARMLGAWSMQVLRGVEDGAAYRAGLNNTTTARDLGALLGAIADGRAASRSACDSMLAILGRQEFNEGIPAGVPPGTRVAHKTGWIGEVVYHDAAIVYPASGGRYVLVIVTGGIKEDTVAHHLVADLSRLVYRAAALPSAGSRSLLLGDGLLSQHLLREPEHQPRDDQEIHGGAEHRTEQEVDGTDVEGRGAPGPSGDEEGDDRHEDAVHQRAHERVRLATDDDGDGQTDDAVLLEECDELLTHEGLLPKGRF